MPFLNNTSSGKQCARITDAPVRARLGHSHWFGRTQGMSALGLISRRVLGLPALRICAKKRHNRLAGTPAGAATLAASRRNGRYQPDAHASNQYRLGQLDPYPQSIVEYVAVSLKRRLRYGDCATPDRRWQLSLLSIGARPRSPRLIVFANWRMTTGGHGRECLGR